MTISRAATAEIDCFELPRNGSQPAQDTDSGSRHQTKGAEYTLLIADLASLQQWRRQLWTIRRTGTLPMVQFQLRELSRDENQSFAALAGIFQRACGCASGGFFMSITVVASVVFYFLSGRPLADINLRIVFSFIGLTAFSAIAGKLIGLLWARLRLLLLAQTVRKKIIKSACPDLPDSL